MSSSLPKTPTPELGNLLNAGALRSTDFEVPQAIQFRRNAVTLMADARASHMSPQGRYILAYEGIHALAVGLIYLYSLAPAGELGHRIRVLQLACKLLQSSTDDFQEISHASAVRNEKLYRSPAPPVGNQESLDLLNIGLKSIDAAGRLFPEWFALK